MIDADHTSTAVSIESAVTQGACLRILNGARSGELIARDQGQTSIGSSRRCTCRLTDAGVAPLHCLIIHDPDGLVARAWAPATLNDIPFEQSRLAIGEVLSIGEVEFEVVGNEGGDEHLPATQKANQIPAFNEAPQAPVLEEAELVTPTAADADKADEQCMASETSQDAVVPASAAEEVFRQLQSANEVARGRSRKLLGALRQHREEYHALATRVDELEQVVRNAASERELAPSDAQSNCVADRAVPTLEEWREVVETSARLSEEVEQLSDAQRRIVDEIVALAQDAADFESRLKSAEFTLADWRNEHTDDDIGSEGSPCCRSAESEIGESCDLVEIDQHEHENVEPLVTSGKTIPIWRLSRTLSAAREGERDTQEYRSTEGAPASDVVEEAACDGGCGESLADEGITATLENVSKEEEARLTPATVEQARATESPDVQTPDSRPLSDPEEAIAHLRELSIWKQDDALGEAAVSATPEATSLEPEPPSTPTKETSPSFIERYAHIFAEEEEASVPSTGSRSNAASNSDDPFRPTAHDPVRTSVENATKVADGEDESIEAYMAKLLQRVRGESAGGDAPRLSGLSNPATTDSNYGTEDLSQVTALAAPPKDVVPMLDIEEMKRREPVPEHLTDLGALRALANESARRAIGTHASRTHRRRALTKVIVALFAGMTSLFLMLQAPGWTDPQFIVACAALMVAAYWAGQSYGAVVQSIRAGAYEGRAPHDADSQLPIDVDERDSL